MYILLEINISKKHILSVGLCILILLAILFLNPLVSVPDGHAGVLINHGRVEDKVVSEGIHLLMPGCQEIINIDCRTQQIELQVPVASRDLQPGSAQLSLRYHINPCGVAKLYRQEGVQYETTLLTPVIEGALQSVSANYTAKEMLYSRHKITVQSSRIICQALAQHNIAVDRIDITGFDFRTPSKLICV